MGDRILEYKCRTGSCLIMRITAYETYGDKCPECKEKMEIVNSYE